jgi:hypothetical protein
MKASEAKQLAANYNPRDNVEIQNKLKKIYCIIRQKAERGNYAVTVPSLGTSEICEYVKEILEKDGYTIKYHSDRRDYTSWYTIAWN